MKRIVGVALGSLVALLASGAHAATPPIYKCFDRDLSVLYTDVPCKGEVVDIRAGDADPAAVARLQRARDALEASADRRIADEHRAALARQYSPQLAYLEPQYGYAAPADEYLYAPFYGYGYGIGYGMLSPYDVGDRFRPRAMHGFRHGDHRQTVSQVPPTALRRR